MYSVILTGRIDGVAPDKVKNYSVLKSNNTLIFNGSYNGFFGSTLLTLGLSLLVYLNIYKKSKVPITGTFEIDIV